MQLKIALARNVGFSFIANYGTRQSYKSNFVSKVISFLIRFY